MRKFQNEIIELINLIGEMRISLQSLSSRVTAAEDRFSEPENEINKTQ